jgi:hypothetical protein
VQCKAVAFFSQVLSASIIFYASFGNYFSASYDEYGLIMNQVVSSIRVSVPFEFDKLDQPERNYGFIHFTSNPGGSGYLKPDIRKYWQMYKKNTLIYFFIYRQMRLRKPEERETLCKIYQ